MKLVWEKDKTIIISDFRIKKLLLIASIDYNIPIAIPLVFPTPPTESWDKPKNRTGLVDNVIRLNLFSHNRL